MIKTGSTLCFAQCLIKADDAVIARANATFRVVPKKANRHSGARSRSDVVTRIRDWSLDEVRATRVPE